MFGDCGSECDALAPVVLWIVCITTNPVLYSSLLTYGSVFFLADSHSNADITAEACADQGEVTCCTCMVMTCVVMMCKKMTR